MCPNWIKLLSMINFKISTLNSQLVSSTSNMTIPSTTSWQENKMKFKIIIIYLLQTWNFDICFTSFIFFRTNKWNKSWKKEKLRRSFKVFRWGGKCIDMNSFLKSLNILFGCDSFINSVHKNIIFQKFKNILHLCSVYIPACFYKINNLFHSS